MIGLIQKVLLDAVEGEGGPEAGAAVRRAAGVPDDRVFRIGVPYDDDECLRLFEAAAQHFGCPLEEWFDVYAGYFFRDAQQRWPMWFAMSDSARDLLERQPVIHNCFATGLRDAAACDSVVDKFRLVPGAADELVVQYRSPNHLSALYVALARWLLRHYGEDAVIERAPLSGSSDGVSEAVEIRVRWTQPTPSGPIEAPR